MSNEEKNLMITQDGCGHCEEAKELLSGKIAAGIVEVVPVESVRGKELADKYDIDATPTILNGKDGNLQKCFLDEEGKKILCDDGSTKEL